MEDPMRTPEDGPIGGSPSHEGGERTPPKGFSIKVENPDLIFEAIRNGVSGEIGKHLLKNPISGVSAEIESNGDTFNLIGTIQLDPIASMKSRVDQKEIFQNVVQRFMQTNPEGQMTERGGNFIMTASRGTKLVFSNELGLSWLYLTTGLVRVGLSSYKGTQLIPAPGATAENFSTAINDFNDVLKVFVEETYRAYGQTTLPDEELVLRPPKVRANGMKGMGKKLFGGTETPKELLDRIEIEKPDIRFEDIGGQAEAKKEIQGLAFALKNPKLYRKWGTKPPKGIILHGPPGTGKTLMAKALASQADARFLHVSTSDIASKWYGESEQIVKTIFELASQDVGNTIIFFDEIDAIAPKREKSHEATHRALSTFLESMDGMSSHENVMVVASTNMLDAIDPALLRAGRFDRWVEVPLPDAEGRKQIFNIHMAIAEKIAGRKLFQEIDTKELAEKTDKFTGADIAETIRRTLEEKVRLEGTLSHEPEIVSTEDIKTRLFFYEKKRAS